MKILAWLTPLSFAFGMVILFAAATSHKAEAVAPAAIAAHQQPAPSPDLGTVLAQALQAIQHGDWRMAAAAGLILLTLLMRWLASGPVPWFKTDEGGTTLVLLLGLLGSFAHTLAAKGVPLSWAMIWQGLQTGLMAGGGYAAIKRLVWPLILKLWGRIHRSPATPPPLPPAP